MAQIGQASPRRLERDRTRRAYRGQGIVISYAAQVIDSARRWVRRKRWAILKYTALTFAGVWLFKIGSEYAYAQRGYIAVGGEMFALLLPLFYYLFSSTVRDFIDAVKGIDRKRDDGE